MNVSTHCTTGSPVRRLARGLGASTFLALSVIAQASTYKAVDIGNLGGTYITPLAVNGSGQVVGSAQLAPVNGAPSRSTAFSYQSGQLTDIGSAPFAGSHLNNAAVAVSDNGHVVMLGAPPGVFGSTALVTTGASGVGAQHVDLGGRELGLRFDYDDDAVVAVNNNGQVVVQLYRADYSGPMRVVGQGLERAGLPGSLLAGLNVHGAVAGTYGAPNGDARGYVMDAQGAFADVGHLGGGSTVLHAINDAGYAVGTSLTEGGSFHAALYAPSIGQLVDLGVLAGGRTSQAFDINENYQVVGRSEVMVNGALEQHAFVASGGVLTDLGMNLEGMRINDLGQVLGHRRVGRYADDDTYDLMLWDVDHMVNLDELVHGIGLTDVQDAVLGENGHIAGWGVDATGARHAFHLFLSSGEGDGGGGGAVPTPGTLSLALLGLVPLWRARRPMTQRER